VLQVRCLAESGTSSDNLRDRRKQQGLLRFDDPRGAVVGFRLRSGGLTFPIAISTDAELGINYRALTIGIAVATCASFLTPVSYQANRMGYELDGYRFRGLCATGSAVGDRVRCPWRDCWCG
jgi:hypothetical protein